MKFQNSGVWVQIPPVSLFAMSSKIQSQIFPSLHSNIRGTSVYFHKIKLMELIFMQDRPRFLQTLIIYYIERYDWLLQTAYNVFPTYLCSQRLAYFDRPITSQPPNSMENRIIHFYFSIGLLIIIMHELRQQNENLQSIIQNYLKQIEEQKESNAQHEAEIETLLKFNERLLGIIQNQLNNNKKERDSLLPISERSQRQSDLIVGPIQSFIKARKLAPMSQRGSVAAYSLVEKTSSKLQFYGKEMRSEINHSSHDGHSDRGIQIRTPLALQTNKAVQASSQVRHEMQQEILQFRKFKTDSTQFYDNKISQIKFLSNKINQYRPMDQIDRINSEFNISANTAKLLKNIINKF